MKTAIASMCLLAQLTLAQTTRTYDYDAFGNRTAASNLLRFTSARGFAVQPRSGLSGERINLIGRNFPAGQTGRVAVRFNGTLASVVSVAERVITLTVPPSVTSGPVTLSIDSATPVQVARFDVAGVTVSPAVVEVDHLQTQQFTATVVGGPSGVTWSVTDLRGNRTGVGTVNANGLYTAPASNTTSDYPFLIRATSPSLRVAGYAIVRAKCASVRTIANRTLLTGTFATSSERHCFEFTGQPGKLAYIAGVATQSRVLTLRNAAGIAVARTVPGRTMRIVDLPIRSAETFRIEIAANGRTGDFSVWVDQHDPLPRGTWMFPLDESWHEPANWSDGEAPRDTDDVVIPDFPNPLHVVVNQDTTCRSLRCSESIRVTAGVFSPADGTSQPCRIDGGLDLRGGSIDGDCDFAIGGASTWRSGRMAGIGKTVFAAGSTLTLEGGSSILILARALESDGAVTWKSGVLRFLGTTLRSRGSWTFDSSTVLTCQSQIGSNNVFESTGTMTKLGAAEARFQRLSSGTDIKLVLSGTVDVQAGRIVQTGPAELRSPLALEGAEMLRLAGGTTTVTGSITGAGHLDVRGSTVVFDNPTNFAPRLTCSGGMIDGAGVLTVTRELIWTSGTLGGAGKTVVASGATLTIVGGSSILLLGRTLENRGVGSWTTGAIRMLDGRFENVGQFTVDNASVLVCQSQTGTGNVFESTGTLTKRGGGELRIQRLTSGSEIKLVVGGTVDVVASSIVHTGPGQILANTTLDGAGKLRLAGGTTSCDGAILGAGNLEVAGGTLMVDGTTPCTPSFTCAGGAVDGTGVFTLRSSCTWKSGAMRGAGQTVVANGATLSIEGGGSILILGRTLANAGTASWTTGALRLQEGTLRNSASMTIDNSSVLVCQSQTGTTNTFENTGTLTKTGAGAVRIERLFSGSEMRLVTGGTVDVQAGRIEHLGPGQILANATLNGAGELRLNGGTTVVAGAIQGAGNLRLSGATLQVDGATSCAPDFAFAGGFLEGSGTLTWNGTCSWSVGTMRGSGRTVVGAGATLAIGGSSILILARTLENDGATTWTSGALRMQDGRILNDGQLIVEPASTLVCQSQSGTTNAIENRAGATFDKRGAGTLRVERLFSGSQVELRNAGALTVSAGTVQTDRPIVQTAGAFALSGGAVRADLDLQGGFLDGAGTITGDVTNAAGVRPGGSGVAGILSITGAYAQTAAGTLHIDLGGTTVGTQHDRLAVSGAVTFAGTLDVALINSFTPVLTQTFGIVTYASRTQTFASCNGCNLGANTLAPTYGATQLDLVVQ